jgi:hypothetical protein
MKANTKQHTVYKTSTGERLPGVTTVINELGWNKNMLIAWSRREALAESAKPGTLTHSFIEGHIKGEKVDTSDFTENQIELAKNSYFAFIEWEKAMKPKYLGTEIQLVSEKYRFGGTADMIGEIGGELVLADWKTSKGIYPEMTIQIAAYKIAYEEMNPGKKVHHGGILRLDRETSAYDYHDISSKKMEWGWEVFQHCLALYALKKKK